MLHTVMHHSSTSTYIPNFIEIEETFCGREYGPTFETHFIRSTPPIITENEHKQLKPGLVTSYNLWRGNGMVLFWKEVKEEGS